MIDIGQLRAIGLPPEAAERAAQALQGGDLRGYVHELLLHGMWNEVIDETQPQPQWIAQWQQLAANGFPIIDTAALQRLLDAGVNAHDLTGVVRSAQILALYNVAQRLDYPTLGLGWHLPDAATPHLACGSAAGDDTQRLHALAPCLLQCDPAGRFGEPRPQALRQWQALPEDVRNDIRMRVCEGRKAQAAALWKRHVGGEMHACLQAMDVLRDLWGSIP